MRLNGNLVLNSDASGEIQHVYIERLASAPTFNAAHKGRLYFNTTSSLYYFNDGAAWVPFATGGNAAALQTEVDNIEASLGAGINAGGTFNANGFNDVTGVLVDPTSFTNAINQLAAAVDFTPTLAELDDVTLGSLSANQVLSYNGSVWVNKTLTVGDIPSITATAAELNILDGATLDVTELNYVDGVTSPIQTQLDNKQPLDATLTALAALSGTGIVVETAADTFVHRTMVAPAAGVTIADAGGVGGNPTFALADDLAGLEGLAATGYAVRIGTSTWTNRTITGQAGQIVVTNGDGVSSNTDVDLAAVTDSGSGTFLKLTRDSYGRVSGTTAVVSSDITGLVSAIYVDVAGDTMSGVLNMGSNRISGLAPGTVGTDAVNKNQLDAAVTGLSWKQAVRAATTGAVALATDLENGDTLDGVTLATGDRVLVKNQAAPAENGIYIVQATGAAVRATDLDLAAEFSGATVFVAEGTAGADTGWTQTTEVVTVGTTAVTWAQFTGSGTYSAGTGLALSGNTFNVNLGAGIAELPSDEVGIDLYSTTDGLRLTTDGSTATTATGGKLTLVLKSAGGLTQDTDGLYVPANGITNAMILNDTNGLNADSGSGTLALGQTLLVAGAAAQGINTSASGQTVTVTAANASSSQKGVATFDATEFTVTAGNVVLGTIANNKLANSVITFAGDNGTPQAVALGATLTVGDGSSHSDVGALVKTTASPTNALDIAVREATATLLGVASFNATDFGVTAGAVTLNARNLSWLTDVTVSSPAAGQTLVYSSGGSEFVNRPTYFLYTSGGASTSHTVTHNLGQKYCNVTVVDSSDEVVIPQSITFSSTSALTVTFTSAIDCKVVVMGVNAA